MLEVYSGCCRIASFLFKKFVQKLHLSELPVYVAGLMPSSLWQCPAFRAVLLRGNPDLQINKRCKNIIALEIMSRITDSYCLNPIHRVDDI